MKLTQSSLPQDISAALERQRAFEARRPTRLGRGAEALTAPFGEIVGRLVPPEWVLKALEASDTAAGWAMPRMSHDRDDLEACLEAALGVQARAEGLNASSGFAAGVAGGPGLAVDIPATLALAARNVRATAAAYGFDEDSEPERAFRLMVLEVATAMAGEARRETLGRLDRLARALSDPAVRAAADTAADWVVNKVVERVARQLGVSLAGRKLGQMVPILGGAVGAVVNASFQADVARAARFAYERRWLMARRLLPPPAQGDTEPRAAAGGSQREEG